MADRVRIYIDSACFIDMVKTHLGKQLETDREKDVWFLKRLFEASRDRELELFASVLSIAECQHAGDGDISEPAKARFDRLLMSGQYIRNCCNLYRFRKTVSRYQQDHRQDQRLDELCTHMNDSS